MGGSSSAGTTTARVLAGSTRRSPPCIWAYAAIVAKSFARIHRRNLISQGILPLLFADEEDYERVEQGDAWKIEGARKVVESRKTGLVAEDDAGGEIKLEASLLPREREILMAGGTLKFLQGSGESASAELGRSQSASR